MRGKGGFSPVTSVVPGNTRIGWRECRRFHLVQQQRQVDAADLAFTAAQRTQQQQLRGVRRHDHPFTFAAADQGADLICAQRLHLCGSVREARSHIVRMDRNFWAIEPSRIYLVLREWYSAHDWRQNLPTSLSSKWKRSRKGLPTNPSHPSARAIFTTAAFA